jgi:hypothetical protein
MRGGSFMVRRSTRFAITVSCVSIAGIAVVSTGCRTPSGYSESRYEYDGSTGASTLETRREVKYRAGQTPPTPPVVEYQSPAPTGSTGEWQFVSPGEMVVDPR